MLLQNHFFSVIVVQVLLDNFVFSDREYQILAENAFRSFEEGTHQYRNFMY